MANYCLPITLSCGSHLESALLKVIQLYMYCTSDDYFLGVSLKSSSNLIYFANTAAKCIEPPTSPSLNIWTYATNTCIDAACKNVLPSCGAGRTHLHVTTYIKQDRVNLTVQTGSVLQCSDWMFCWMMTEPEFFSITQNGMCTTNEQLRFEANR